MCVRHVFVYVWCVCCGVVSEIDKEGQQESAAAKPHDDSFIPLLAKCALAVLACLPQLLFDLY